MNWVRAVQEAGTIEGVLEVVNDFIAHQPESFWEWVPEAARPTEVQGEEELHRWHHWLVEQLARSKSPPNIRMQDLCVFFVRASIRAHQIRIKSSDPNSSNESSFSAAGRKKPA